MIQSLAGVVKLVDTIDSKSIERKLVSVQVRSPVNTSKQFVYKQKITHVHQ